MLLLSSSAPTGTGRAGSGMGDAHRRRLSQTPDDGNPSRPERILHVACDNEATRTELVSLFSQTDPDCPSMDGREQGQESARPGSLEHKSAAAAAAAAAAPQSSSLAYLRRLQGQVHSVKDSDLGAGTNAFSDWQRGAHSA